MLDSDYFTIPNENQIAECRSWIHRASHPYCLSVFLISAEHDSETDFSLNLPWRCAGEGEPLIGPCQSQIPILYIHTIIRFLYTVTIVIETYFL